MAKKTARPTSTKPAQQRSKEEQWRKRMAAQARTGTGTDYVATNGAGSMSAVAEPEDETLDGATERIVPASASTTAARTTTSTRAQAPTAARSAAAVGAMRRSLTPRGRAQASAMTIDEEMHYIKGDIRRLIFLTAVCLVILIALAFIVPMIVK